VTRTKQRDALVMWFDEYETINLAQSNAGIPDPRNPSGPKVYIKRVATLVAELRDAGWVISTGKDAAGNAYYRVVSRPDRPVGGTLKKDPDREQARDAKAGRDWHCSKQGCISEVIPDVVTQFDSRYTTGRCLTHGKQVLVKD
jgi:hypothetical protein